MRRTFELLVSSVQNQVGWSVFLVLYPGQHYVCRCAYVCASILFFMSLVYLVFTYHPWSTCLLPCLSLSLICECWPGFGENNCFIALDFVHVSVDS